MSLKISSVSYGMKKAPANATTYETASSLIEHAMKGKEGRATAYMFPSVLPFNNNEPSHLRWLINGECLSLGFIYLPENGIDPHLQACY